MPSSTALPVHAKSILTASASHIATARTYSISNGALSAANQSTGLVATVARHSSIYLVVRDSGGSSLEGSAETVATLRDSVLLRDIALLIYHRNCYEIAEKK